MGLLDALFGGQGLLGPQQAPQGAPPPQVYPQNNSIGMMTLPPAQYAQMQQQQQLLGAAFQSLPADMPFAQKMAIIQNPALQVQRYGVQSLGAGKTPGGYEGQIVNNAGRVGMAFPTADGQAPADAGVRTFKPGEMAIDFSGQPNAPQTPGAPMASANGTQPPASAIPGQPPAAPSQGKVLFQNNTGLLNPDTVDYLARQLNAGDQSVLANLSRTAQGAQNIVAVRQRAVELQGQGGVSPETASAKTAEYGGFTSGQKTLGTRLANVSLAVNEAQRLIPQALDASANAPRSQYMPVNKIIQSYQENTGDPNIVKLGAALYGLTHVYARAVNPQGVAAEGDLNHAQQILDKALAKGQLAGGIQQLYQEMHALQGSPNDVRQEMRDHFTGQKGASDSADALLQGKLAISQGAPRAAVIKRLMEKGIDPNGL